MRRFNKTNKSAYLNFLLAKYEMYTGSVEVRSRPYYLAIDPSSICQLRCPTCPTGIENESIRSKAAMRITYRSGRTQMTDERFDALLEEMGEYLFRIMFYNWGEPLLNQELPRYIEKAKAYDIETDVNTNLSLQLSDRFIEDLLTSGLDSLSASIDGFSQATYETYRAGGRLDLVKSNLERFARARDRLGLETNIEWNLLVFSFNEHEIPDARKYCKALGISFNTRDAYIDNPDWLPEHRRDEKPMAESPEWNEPVVWSPIRNATRSQDARRCAWHYGYSIVNADGSVSPCCASWSENDDFGTVIPGSIDFAEIWNSDLLRRSRAAFAGKQVEGLENIETLCTRCPYGSGIQHLYSLFDINVLLQFHRAFGRSEPLLARAFDLLARVRFGRIYAGMVRHGLAFQLMSSIKGKEDAKRMSGWVAFFEEHVLNHYFLPPSTVDSQSDRTNFR